MSYTSINEIMPFIDRKEDKKYSQLTVIARGEGAPDCSPLPKLIESYPAVFKNVK